MTTAATLANRDGKSSRRGDHSSALESHLLDFNAICPDEESAKAIVFTALLNKGVACDCGKECTFDSESKRAVDCRICYAKVWITAKSKFARVRRFRPWLTLIFLMEHGVAFNPHQLSFITKFACSTIKDIKARLDLMLAREMPEDAPRVPSALFTRLFLRRTTETPARSHPREEQTQIDREAVKSDLDAKVTPNVVLSETDAFSGTLSEGEQKVWNCLTEELTHLDTLCCRAGMPIGEFSATMLFLELRGLVKGSHDYYAREPVAQNIITDVDVGETPVNEFKELVKSISGGVGRRLIQCHLAAYWCFSDRERWGPGKLLAACLRSPPISREELRSYVSPRMVKILPKLAVNQG